ncbi:MAG: ParA family protein [Aigarchaeota archaeon]|nr:ParA family protein [Aigarchaeota archaeon]MCX8192207.1 ParA family protein [Nitrososphaeria archaeon]MDW7986186.1 ParA family protein [Nitrososphaerota archaeon]
MVFSVQHSRGGSGATSVALTLAYNLARRGRTLYVEADFLNPVLEHLIPIERHVAKWSNDWITGEASIEEASIDVSDTAGLPSQSLYAIYANTSEGARRRMEILDAEKDKRIVKALERERWIIRDEPLDYVVIDTPPWMFYTLAVVSYISDFVIYVLRPSLYEFKIFKDRMENIYSHFKCSIKPVINFYDQTSSTVKKFEKEFKEYFGGAYVTVPTIPETSSGIDISRIFSSSSRYTNHLKEIFTDLPLPKETTHVHDKIRVR